MLIKDRKVRKVQQVKMLTKVQQVKMLIKDRKVRKVQQGKMLTKV